MFKQKMMMAFAVIGIAAGMVMAQDKQGGFDKVLLHGGGSDEGKIVIHIAGDGYSAGEQGSINDAPQDKSQTSFIAYAKAIKDIVLGYYPYNQFADKINMYAIKVVSTTPGGFFNTVGSSSNTIKWTGGVYALYDGGYPTVDAVIVISKNTQMNYAWPSTRTMVVQSTAIAPHELGHVMGYLRDSGGERAATVEGPNMSYNSDRNTIRWKSLIGVEGIDLEECRYQPQYAAPSPGWYRPTPRSGCTMAGGGREYCAVCAAALTERMAKIAGIPFYGTLFNGVADAGPFKDTPLNTDEEIEHEGQIVEYAFHGLDKLRDLTLTNVNSIGKYAFIKCESLETITVDMATPPTIDADREFYGVDRSLIRLIVPTGKEQAYMDAGWEGFDMDGSGTPATYFDVLFDSDGGSDVAKKSVREGRTVVKPTDPTKAGFTFAGWYKDEACTEEWDFANDKVTGDITIFAKWEEKAKIDITGYSAMLMPSSVWDYSKSSKPNFTIMGFLGATPSSPTIVMTMNDYTIEYEYDFSVDNTKATIIITPKSETNYIGQIRQEFSVLNAPNEGSSIPQDPEDTPIFGVNKPAKKMLFKSTIVSDKMEIALDNFRDVRFVVYDMTGNVVSDGKGKIWNLRNKAGRFVANGSYLVVVEAKDNNGMKYRWSDKIGVKR
jgi:uncharacterized repeat protein (TIGR02543 family)